MFCFDFSFPKVAEAVRSHQLQNDRLTLQRINRVFRFDDFREIWSEHSPIDKEQKGVSKYVYSKYFFRGGL